MRSTVRISVLGAAALLTLAVAALFFHRAEPATHVAHVAHAADVGHATPSQQVRLALHAEASTPDRVRGQAEEDMIDETFSVQPGEALRVDVAHSDVHIEKGAGNEARIRVVLEGQEITDRLRNFFEYLNFEVGQTDGAVFVRTDPEGNWRWTRNGWRLRGSVHVYISVPELFDADIDVAHGDVDIHALKGVLNMDLAHGDIDAESLSGPSLSMDIAHGDVQTGQVGSERVRLNVRHGDLSVHSMDARTMHVDTAHGDIELNRVAAETVRIRTSHGDIDLDRLDAGEIDVDISHGDIHVQSMNGYPRMHVHHGDISLYFVEAVGGKFNAAHGDIDLYAPAQATLDVDLRASDVSMADAFQTGFEGMRKNKEVQGRIHGGGPELHARASHGDVALRVR